MRLLVMAAALASCVALAHADTRAHEDSELARYSRYAGPPIDSFYMHDLWQTQVVGPNKLLVWPKINEVYLLTVDKPCNRLEWSHGVAVTQAMHWNVTKAFDFVDFDHEHCKIVEIRPIDYNAMRLAERGANSSQPSNQH